VIFYHQGEFFQPRQHPAGHGDLAPQRLYAWAASKAFAAGAKAAKT